ncbi:uncharacterized protein LY89DRAFT_725197 [Mollisia scopiformis]|uniref:Uncharacterized protein n=1 Tax=Mollisia scopiformis TaxID=149040 RepID=A0A132B7B3_MOLSC|nr:uncharacterized protein LY89DRAFT_725197 [Mollisia scopiformis]KUJ08296.1 hypothetical protein LY89DRAFT_725197 [Mollisia scopiformis]
MQTFAITTLLALAAASLTSAAPVAEPRQFQAQLTFYGAAGASYSLSVPADASEFYIDNPLSVSKISLEGGASCGIKGIDGSETVVVGANTVDVGPPQTQVSGSCLAL